MEDLMNVIYLTENGEMIHPPAVKTRNRHGRRFGLVLAASRGSIGRLFQWSNPFRTLNYHGRRQPALLVLWTLLFIGYLPSKLVFKLLS